MKTETEKIISLLKRTFDKGAWHGPSVMEAIERVTEQSAHNRLPNTHSIIELVAHMTAWRNFTISRLEGNNDFTVTDELNFPAAKDWKKTVSELKQSQDKLIAAVAIFPIEKLNELVAHAENKYTYYTLLHGIIHHDLYHTGQIMLIVKATTAQTLQTF